MKQESWNMDKDESSNDGGGGDKSKDVDSPPEIIEVKEDSQDGKSSPIGVESPSGGDR